MGNSEGGLRIVENSDLLYEYNKNVRPAVISFSLGLDYPASCPNLLAGFIHIKPNDSFKQDSILTCTPLCLYVIRGCGTTKIADEGQVDWSEDDLLVVPYQTQALNHFAHEDTAFYYVHDEPLLKYLRAKPAEKAFTTTIFRSHVLREKVESIREKPGSEHANRLGTLIGNPDISETKSLTHTLWALMNVLPANSLQKPHRHNAVALDLVTYAPKGKCYTLIGYDLNEDGTIRSPTRLEWKSGSAFTTPLGMWHSHHNESTDEDAWILPMQDAGLSKLEILPNEIFFNIFSHLLWNDILTSFWLLNKRFNSLIYLNFSINNCGIIINKTSLSYKIFLSKLFPLISNCSSLINSIRHIHLDGTCPHSYDFFNKNHCIQNYPNLKSLILDQFYLSKKFRAEKLKYLILKSTVEYDGQLYYLKWFFNNLNSVEKIKIRLKIDGTCEKNPIIYGSIVDANFIRKYLMNDRIINLIHFDFYIVSKCKLLSNYSERTINSFKNHSFFIERHWTNVKCLFDEIKFYQHLSSSPSTINNLSEYFHDLIIYPDIFYWPNVKYIQIDLNENVYSHLERFDKCFPNVSCVKFNTAYYERFVDQNTERAKILARIISMPIQLNYLRIENFQWLLHLVEYAFDELKENALSNVRYTEFSLPSCRRGTNESVHLGKYLVPFLSKHMPYLQTLCLWKPDDFPWSSTGKKFRSIFINEFQQLLVDFHLIEKNPRRRKYDTSILSPDSTLRTGYIPHVGLVSSKTPASTVRQNIEV
ncbi:unnamed protein product [Rotaria sp. Silwood1]|nr:unnamed protein product [Rotaria sp. Silwood1]